MKNIITLKEVIDEIVGSDVEVFTEVYNNPEITIINNDAIEIKGFNLCIIANTIINAGAITLEKDIFLKLKNFTNQGNLITKGNINIQADAILGNGNITGENIEIIKTKSSFDFEQTIMLSTSKLIEIEPTGASGIIEEESYII